MQTQRKARKALRALVRKISTTKEEDWFGVIASAIQNEIGIYHYVKAVTVKAALLDQRAVAGIGNIYAAEILFRVGIDPRIQCRRLRAETWERIAVEARRVLAEAIRLEGSSIGDETYRTADARPGRAQRRHRVYGREGKPCRRCQTPVERIVLAQRATFFCPACQTK